MTIGILSLQKQKTPLNPEARLLLAAGSKRGHTMMGLYEPSITALHTENGLQLFHGSSSFPACDIILCRASFINEPSLHTPTLQFIEQAGYRLLSSSSTLLACKNKLQQHIILSQARIPMPEWAIVRDPHEIGIVVEKLGFPLVVKIAFGMRGKGVFFADRMEVLRPLVDYLIVRDHNPVLIERFVGESERKDCRLFVVGNRVVAAMEGCGSDEDIRFGKGGVYAKPASPESIDLALRATRALGVNIAGVDIIQSKNGPLVLEVNANPGFRHIKDITGVDIAEKIIEYLEEIVSVDKK